MNKLKYIAFRTLQTIFLFMLIVTALFFFFRLMPGDITDIMLARGANEETIQAFRKERGLDKPIYIQYWIFLKGLFQGDFGTSIQRGAPVLEVVAPQLLNTFILVAPAITCGYIVGSILGAIYGTTDRAELEQVGVSLAVFLGTIPLFFSSIVAIIIFSGKLGWLPSSGMLSTEAARQLGDVSIWKRYLTKDFAYHYILPFSVIMVRYSYLPTLLMRTNIVEVKGQDFSYYQRIAGLSKWKRLKTLSKHASLPVITYYPLSMTRAIGGLVLVEMVFNWPGIGYSLVQAVLFRDFPIVQLIFILIAAFVLISNFLVDIIYGVIDPRVSLGGGD